MRLGRLSHERPASGLDRSHHHRWDCRLVGRAIHEELNGAPDEYHTRYHRGGDWQRYFDILWGQLRGMDRLLDCRVHRRSLANLDRADGKGQGLNIFGYFVALP